MSQAATQMPRTFSSSIVCAIFVTLTQGMYSMAPADALATISVSPQALRFGITMPCAPAHSALRMMAPRLCGSSRLSKIRINGSSPRASAKAKISSSSLYAYGLI